MGFMHYKTRGQSTPQGKQHVFFSAHPIDQKNTLKNYQTKY